MKATLLILTAAVLLSGCHTKQKDTLQDALHHNFLIGVATTPEQCKAASKTANILKEDFSTIVAENCMKSERIQATEGCFYFDAADTIVNFANCNGQFMVGHCLVWHSQLPAWFLVDSLGQEVSREVLVERMRQHIVTVVSHYKGKVQGWDVVNEALNDDGTLRQSPFYRIIGEDYIQLAFQFAHEADPDAELYYNDYSMYKPEKCQGAIKLIKSLRDKGLRVDAVGMQSHYLLDDFVAEKVETSILSFAQADIPVMITELDLSVLPFPDRSKAGAEVSTNFEYQKQMNPYAEVLPMAVAEKWEAQMLDYFRIFIKHSDKIKRVTFWGLGDGDSWKNDWPMNGRTDYPLLYDRNYNQKPIVEKIKQLAETL